MNFLEASRPKRSLDVWLVRMARRKTRESLARDHEMLRDALSDCEAGAMAHLEPSERASVVQSIKQRIAALDAIIGRVGDR